MFPLSETSPLVDSRRDDPENDGREDDHNDDCDEEIAPPPTLLERATTAFSIAQSIQSDVSAALWSELHPDETEASVKQFFLATSLIRNSGFSAADLSTGLDDVSSMSSFPSTTATGVPPPATPSYVTLGNVPELDLLPQESLTIPPALSDDAPKEAIPSSAATPGVPASAYFLLASAVVSLSFIAPLLDLQEGDPIMKIVWRLGATTILFFPLAVWTRLREGGFGITSRKATPSMMAWGYALLAGALYSPFCTTFAVALEHTTVQDVVAFSNTQSLLLLVGKVLLGSAVSGPESVGALTAFGGAVFCNRDSAHMLMEQVPVEAGSGPHDDDSFLDADVLYGDALSFASAFFGVGYLVLSKLAREEISLYPFMFVVMLAGTAVSIGTAAAMGKPILLWSTDEDWGALGFLHWDRFDRLPLEILTVVVCNVFGTMGYIRALHYFDPLVITVVALSEPVVAQLLAAAARVGLVPGWRGWFGNALIAAGTYGVAYQPPEKRREMKTELRRRSSVLSLISELE